MIKIKSLTSISAFIIILILVSSYASAKPMVSAANNGNKVTANMTSLMCTALVQGVKTAGTMALCGEMATAVCATEAGTMDIAAGGPEDPAGDAVAGVSLGVCETTTVKMCKVAFSTATANVNQMTQSNVVQEVINVCAKDVYTPICNAFTLGMTQSACEPKYINIHNPYN